MTTTWTLSMPRCTSVCLARNLSQEKKSTQSLWPNFKRNEKENRTYLWKDEIRSRHFETMGQSCSLLASAGGSSFQGLLGAKWKIAHPHVLLFGTVNPSNGGNAPVRTFEAGSVLALHAQLPGSCHALTGNGAMGHSDCENVMGTQDLGRQRPFCMGRMGLWVPMLRCVAFEMHHAARPEEVVAHLVGDESLRPAN